MPFTLSFRSSSGPSYSAVPLSPSGRKWDSTSRRSMFSPRRLLVAISAFGLVSLLFLAADGSQHEQIAALGSTAQQAWTCAVQATKGVKAAPIYVSPLASSSVLLIKTGHSVAHARLAPHLEQPRLDIPNRIIYSDYPLRYAGVEVVDIVANITHANYDKNDMKVYTDLHESVDNGVLPENLAAFNMWQLDKYKFVPMHAHAYRAFPNAKWYIAMDGDTFLFWNNVLRWLELFDENEPYYFGNRHETNSRVWAQGGSGYVLSKGVMDKTIALDPWGWERSWDKVLNSERGGDVVLGRILKETPGMNISEPHARSKNLFNGNPIADLLFSKENWLAPLLSLHHLKPSEVHTLRAFEERIQPTIRPGDYIRHCDLMRALAPGFLRDELDAVFSGSAWGRVTYRKKAWRAAEPNAVVFTNAWSKSRGVAYTADFCDSLCTEREDCFSWTFEDHMLESGRRCVHARNAFGFGSPHHEMADGIPKDQEARPKFESGWRLDRIRKIQHEHSCNGEDRQALDVERGWAAYAPQSGAADEVNSTSTLSISFGR